MNNKESFEQMLTGGHHNSLGRTVEVVEKVLKDRRRLAELYDCYFSKDEVVRLRTSNAFKRIAKTEPYWLTEYIDRFISEISKIDQASTQWTLAFLFLELHRQLLPGQIAKAKEIMKNNLINHKDWIVINTTMQTLAMWARSDEDLREWILPVLKRFTLDEHVSISSRAQKLIKILK